MIVPILLIASAICFGLEAFGVPGRIKWWALGAALFVLAQFPF